MKKILLSLVVVGIAAAPFLAMAQPSVTISDLPSLVNKIKSVVWTVFGLLAVIAFVIAGILFLTSNGNPEKIAQARNAFLWGVVGVVVGIIAYSIVEIVSTAL